MSVAPMGADSAGYYVGMVLDVEDYYLQPSEEPGRWHGRAAADLGLSGRVERADLEALLEGRDPRTGTRIGTWTKRPAYDLTLSAPKSVSLMWGLGDRGVASTVESAHDRAVEAAFAYLDEYACVVRRGHGGTIRFDGDGLIAAVFRHRTSRALDPDLHSHVLVANMTRGADGEWSCPFGTLLFRHARAAGCIYQSVLRRELSERLGVRFGEVTKGSADIVGIDRPARRAFSKRRTAIEERMAEQGTKSRRGAEIAALDTRPNKGEPIAEADLRQVWSVEAAEIGLDVASSLGRPGPVAVDVGSDADLAQVLTEKDATFERRRIVEAVASSSRSGLRPEEIEVRIDEFIDSDYCLRLPTGRYTTPEMLAIETEVVDFATTSPARASATQDAVAEAMRVRPSLSAQQRLAVGSITGSDPISCVVGHAGAGKTFALDAARAAGRPAASNPSAAPSPPELPDSSKPVRASSPTPPTSSSPTSTPADDGSTNAASSSSTRPGCWAAGACGASCTTSGGRTPSSSSSATPSSSPRSTPAACSPPSPTASAARSSPRTAASATRLNVKPPAGSATARSKRPCSS